MFEDTIEFITKLNQRIFINFELDLTVKKSRFDFFDSTSTEYSYKLNVTSVFYNDIQIAEGFAVDKTAFVKHLECPEGDFTIILSKKQIHLFLDNTELPKNYDENSLKMYDGDRWLLIIIALFYIGRGVSSIYGWNSMSSQTFSYLITILGILYIIYEFIFTRLSPIISKMVIYYNLFMIFYFMVWISYVAIVKYLDGSLKDLQVLDNYTVNIVSELGFVFILFLLIIGLVWIWFKHNHLSSIYTNKILRNKFEEKWGITN